MTSYDAQRLVQAGGVEWKRDSRHRVYFESVASLYGLKCENDPQSGQLVSATLDGAALDVAEARALLVRLKDVKIWYDLGKKTFRWREAPDIEAIADKIVRAIELALPPEQEPDPSRIHEYGGTFHVKASLEFAAALERKDPDAAAQAQAKLALIRPRPSPLSPKKARR